MGEISSKSSDLEKEGAKSELANKLSQMRTIYPHVRMQRRDEYLLNSRNPIHP